MALDLLLESRRSRRGLKESISATVFDTKKTDIHIPILTPATRPVSEVLQKEKPVIKRQMAMQGNVNRSKFLRP
jgi:hypothetical protein